MRKFFVLAGAAVLAGSLSAWAAETSTTGKTTGNATETPGHTMDHMTAGMHTVFMLRLELDVGVFGHRQSVHVASQQDGRALLGTTQRDHETRSGLALDNLDIEASQRFARTPGGLRQMQAKLGELVQFAPQRDDHRQHLAGACAPETQIFL